MKKQQPDTGNAFDKLIKQQWRTEEEYKKAIVALELQNQKYRNELYELGETVNKILEKTKIPNSSKTNTPNMQQQLELVKKQLHNVNQFIEIYQKQLQSIGNKKKPEQMDSIANTQAILKAKNQELNGLKREVKEMSHKNKALEYRLLQFNKRNKAKSVDQQALQLKQLISENKNLKSKLEQLEIMHEKKQNWLKNNIKSAKNLEEKVKEQESKLPKINSKGSLREKAAAASLPKLQSEKKIYTKWLQNTKSRTHNRIDKQIEDLEKVSDMLRAKIEATTDEIKRVEEDTQILKAKVEANQLEFVQEDVDDGNPKKKDVGCMAVRKVRKVRRDWVGKFDTLRFSDSRAIRQQTRIYKVLFNTSGYFQFFYYSVKDKKKTYAGKLPFDPNSLTNAGKQSTFTVEYPDFIKNLRLRINIRTQRILQMILVSNLGVQGEFVSEGNTKEEVIGGKPESKPLTAQNTNEVYYDMDIKPNEAITCMFGSYGIKTDEKKNIVAVWLQGLGVQLIQDFVEEML